MATTASGQKVTIFSPTPIEISTEKLCLHFAFASPPPPPPPIAVPFGFQAIPDKPPSLHASSPAATEVSWKRTEQNSWELVAELNIP